MSEPTAQPLPAADGAQRTSRPQRRTLRSFWDDGWAVLRARWYLRRATSIGRRTRLWGRAMVSSYGTLLVGERARLVGTIVPLELATGPRGRLEIGEGTFINYGCSIAASQLVRIGAHCNIGTYAIIMDNDFHRIEPERRNERPESAPIVLEDNVWLGARVTVLRGVTIGGGSVVGAGSVVVKDIPPRSLAVGTPAKVIRKL
jgi:acetyltransferase-like isoleucine patch superfamily enzyme